MLRATSGLVVEIAEEVAKRHPAVDLEVEAPLGLDRHPTVHDLVRTNGPQNRENPPRCQDSGRRDGTVGGRQGVSDGIPRVVEGRVRSRQILVGRCDTPFEIEAVEDAVGSGDLG